jgi:hypothetical protein
VKYQVEVLVEVELDLEDRDGEAEAVKTVDEILQRAWDTDRDSDIELHNWHFEIPPGAAERAG